MTSDPRSAAIYVRISEDREGAHLGVDRQRADCEELAAGLGWNVVEVYVDNDLSAYSGKRRPGYQELLDDMRTARITGVLAWHTDRLHRSPMELEAYISASELHGAITQTVKAGEIDLSTPSGRAVARTLGAWARYESEHRGERVAAARRQRVVAGKWGGGIRPFGWEPDGITIRPGEAAELAKATDTLLAGGSLRAIVHDLNGREMFTSRGALWTPKTLRDALSRPRNAGLLVHKGEILGEAPWPAIVPEQSWRGLLAMFSDPSRKTSPGSVIRWLGSGLYRCGTCGSNQVICSTSGSPTRNGNKRKPAYRCRSRQSEGTSHHFVRVAEGVDSLVTQTLVARLEHRDAAELVAERSSGLDSQALHSEALGLRQRLTDLSDAFADGEVTRTQLATATKRMNDRLAEVESQIGRAANRNPLVGIAGADDVRAVWDSLDLSRQRAILDTLVTVTILPSKRGPRFDPSTIDITWKA